MKTITILIAALFTLQVSVLFAGNESTILTSSPVAVTFDMTSLIPIIPAEATFEEVAIEVIDLGSVAPVVPTEAGFEDVVAVIDLDSLAPVVPAEANFSDTADQMVDISLLAPVAPVVLAH